MGAFSFLHLFFLFFFNTIISRTIVEHPLIIDNLITKEKHCVNGSFDIDGEATFNSSIVVKDSHIIGTVDIGEIPETQGGREEAGLIQIIIPKNITNDNPKYIGYLSLIFCADTCLEEENITQMFKAKYLFYFSNSHTMVNLISVDYYTNEEPGRPVQDYQALALDPLDSDMSKWFSYREPAVKILFKTPVNTKLENVSVLYKLKIAGKLRTGLKGCKIIKL